jgi:hypothetical protein
MTFTSARPKLEAMNVSGFMTWCGTATTKKSGLQSCRLCSNANGAWTITKFDTILKNCLWLIRQLRSLSSG